MRTISIRLRRMGRNARNCGRLGPDIESRICVPSKVVDGNTHGRKILNDTSNSKFQGYLILPMLHVYEPVDEERFLERMDVAWD